MIIRGGENIRPLEIENCILSHPAVSDVSAVGVPDERYGEVVGVFIIPTSKPTTLEQRIAFNEIKEWVKARLSPHLVPRFVFIVNSFPKTASGKIQKFALRQQAVDLIATGKGTD